MEAIYLILIISALVIVGILAAVYLTSRYFFRTTILRKPTATLNNNINANTSWEQHLEFIRERKAWLETQPLEDVFIESFDGLKLHSTFLRCEGSKNFVICFHGYTSKGLSDYGAIAKFYHEQGFNLLINDARNHGESQGQYTGFGVLDRFDVQSWCEYCTERFGKDVKILLHGDSMGGATVLMASGLPLPQNVRGIIADCAFTSAYDVFSHILKRDYHIPNFPIMFITELMTKKKAGYGYKDVSTIEAVRKTQIPILFIHGDKDDFVPLWMTEKNYEACNSPKELLIIKGADHAEAYYKDTEAFEAAVKNMIDKYIAQYKKERC